MYTNGVINSMEYRMLELILQESHPSFQERKGGLQKLLADDDKADVEY